MTGVDVNAQELGRAPEPDPRSLEPLLLQQQEQQQQQPATSVLPPPSISVGSNAKNQFIVHCRANSNIKWIVCAVAILVWSTVYTNAFLPAFLENYMAQEFGWSALEFAIFVSSAYFVAMFAPLIARKSISKFSAFGCLLLMQITAIFSSMCIIVATHIYRVSQVTNYSYYVLMYFSRILIGIAMGVCDVLLPSILFYWFPKSNHGLIAVQCLSMLGIQLGLIFGRLGFVPFSRQFGLQNTFVFVSCLSGIVIVFLILLIKFEYQWRIKVSKMVAQTFSEPARRSSTNSNKNTNASTDKKSIHNNNNNNNNNNHINDNEHHKKGEHVNDTEDESKHSEDALSDAHSHSHSQPSITNQANDSNPASIKAQSQAQAQAQAQAQSVSVSVSVSASQSELPELPELPEMPELIPPQSILSVNDQYWYRYRDHMKLSDILCSLLIKMKSFSVYVWLIVINMCLFFGIQICIFSTFTNVSQILYAYSEIQSNFLWLIPSVFTVLIVLPLIYFVMNFKTGYFYNQWIYNLLSSIALFAALIAFYFSQSHGEQIFLTGMFIYSFSFFDLHMIAIPNVIQSNISSAVSAVSVMFQWFFAILFTIAVPLFNMAFGSYQSAILFVLGLAVVQLMCAMCVLLVSVLDRPNSEFHEFADNVA